MFKLNDAQIELEIKSPSELIARLEYYKKAFEEVEYDPKEFIGNNSVSIIGQFTIANNMTITLCWKPQYDENQKIINL